MEHGESSVREPATAASQYVKYTISMHLSEDRANVLTDSLEVVMIYVDCDDWQVFGTHEDALKKHSRWFRVALNQGLIQSEGRRVNFPDDDPHIFKLFLHFVYTGKIYSAINVQQRGGDDEWLRLINLWSLGERLETTSLKDATVDALIEKIIMEHRCPDNLHSIVYNRSAPGQGLRLLLIDVAVCDWTERSLIAAIASADTHKDFLADITQALVRIKDSAHIGRGRAPYYNNTCHYHEHDAESTPCYKTMF